MVKKNPNETRGGNGTKDGIAKARSALQEIIKKGKELKNQADIEITDEDLANLYPKSESEDDEPKEADVVSEESDSSSEEEVVVRRKKVKKVETKVDDLTELKQSMMSMKELLTSMNQPKPAVEPVPPKEIIKEVIKVKSAKEAQFDALRNKLMSSFY